MLVLFSGSLLGFCDRLFLSYYSYEALQACVSASSFVNLFQIPTISIASIAQVFVGRYKGQEDYINIGNSVWQMIWWACLSVILVLPLGFAIEPYYFQRTSIATLGHDYFRPLLLFNFLFPLGAALSSFYIGQGKTKIVFLVTLVTHLFNILLAPLLIFGIRGVLSPLGVLGAATAAVVAQIVYCSILFALFLQRKNRDSYGTGNYVYDKARFLEGLKIGMPNALSRVITLLTWAGATQMMFRKGGDYSLVLSVDSTIHFLFTFLNEGIGQAVIPIASYFHGKGERIYLQKLKKSAYLLLSLFLLFLSIPCLIFPELTISIVLKDPLSHHQLQLLKATCHWLWIYFLTYGFGRIGSGFLIAAKDTMFLFIYNASSSWIITYGFVFCVIQVLGYSPDKLWLTMSITSLISGIAYFWRIKYQERKIGGYAGM
jgi:MATE family multidrug resistance protein